MIIAHADRKDGRGRLLLLGLSRQNLEGLIQGRPIHLSRATHGDGIPEDWEVGILFGETEQAIADELRLIGAVDNSTRIEVEERLAPPRG